ncbi:hypothetical protein GGX14DRAFT_480411 [Mycena pura]|uniref:Uncharacterized protein n=1 Tax=Mycena pura TaxID=153505 RepID=A0AAD6UPY1_9AGAR|nr:hypothetical protein GGX14DRAFT_480411 [Mycena pura]
MADTLLISPSGSTVLDGLTSLPVDALDAFTYGAANAYVIHELIDIPRFAAALARQPLPFIPPLTPARQMVFNPDAPLAAVLITHFPNLSASCVAVRRWHPIGSDFVASRFIRAVSKFYLDAALSARDLDEPTPVYESLRHFLPPNPDRALLQGIDTSAVETYFNPDTTPHPQLVLPAPNVRLDFRLSGAQVAAIRTAIRALGPGGPDTPLVSAQDCLVALVAVALNAADPGTSRIHTIDTILDVRGQAGVPAELSWNGTTFAPTDRIALGPAGAGALPVDDSASSDTELYTYASAIRRSLARAREPAFLAALIDLQAQRAAEAIARGGPGGGEIIDLASKPGHLCVNSTLRLDAAMRPHTHFGHPGELRSYVSTVPFVRHLKLARPNEPPPPSNPFLADTATPRDPLEAEEARMAAVEATLFFPDSASGYWFGGVGPRERFVREMEARVRAVGGGTVQWVR